MDDLFNRTIGYAERAFKTNTYINLVVVGVGITILVPWVDQNWKPQGFGSLARFLYQLHGLPAED